MKPELITALDLNFLGMPGVIAAYLVPHRSGVFLIECGPGSTIGGLQVALEAKGYSLDAVTDVLLTHIHLDHAGAAGWLARQGINIHVHPVGAPHLLNPEKLLSSAARIYKDQMEVLWGDFLSVPEGQLNIIPLDAHLSIGGVQIQALDTPGHAEHHFAYLVEDICFSGDIGGVRVGGSRHVRLPMPPPEFHLEKWRQSIQKLRQVKFKYIAPTHFGVFSDVDWHLDAVEENLNDIDEWIQENASSDISVPDLNEVFLTWTAERARQAGITPEIISLFEAANPSWMSGAGIQRYWRKYRAPADND